MMIWSHRFSAALLVLVLAATGFAEDKPAPAADNEAAKSEGQQLFEQTILPALTENCFACHSKTEDVTEGGLELDSAAGLRQGGDNGPILESHESDSRLLKMLRHQDGELAMPPEERLSDEVIAAFEKWIQLGAPDTRKDTGLTAREERARAARQHWAFQPLAATELPGVKDAAWPRDKMIDTLVLAQIEAKGLKPVADASRATLIRRLSFDITGLPPTPEQIDAFQADDSPQAVETLVDRLLASRQFGERWGRHWLDVVRYAESSGMEFNFTYPHAWPFRDYVYDSLNADKPYDQFLREQIAGDLLPAPEGETHAQKEDRLIAPSILAFGPKRHNSGGTGLNMDIADDQIDVVFKSTMGLTVACARCHDHKFDPIPTKDYYSLAGIFLSTKPLFGTIRQKYSNNPTELLAMGEDGEERHKAAVEWDKKVSDAKTELAAVKEKLKKATTAEEAAKKEKTDVEQLLAAVTDREKATDGESDPEADAKSRADAETKLTKATETLSSASAQVAELKKQVDASNANVESLKRNHPGRPQYAMTVHDREKPSDTKIAIRGQVGNRGEVAPRGFLSAVNVPNAAAVNPEASGRLELAEWIASPENPITARVMVNRIWHHLFGRGIVPTVDNFGLIGKAPTHPELLDMLALRFIEDGWSVKRMIRAVVLSRAYQLSSTADANNMEIDPDNSVFWRASPRRLEAEAIRDAILAVSGQLNLERRNGSSVTGLGDKLVRGIPLDKLQPASNDRSAYLPVVRDYVPEIFDLFDFPSPSLVTGRRAVTDVPAQALYLRNSKFIAEQSRLAATRLLADTEGQTDADRLNLATRRALGRTVTEDEQQVALQMINRIREAKDGEKAAADESADEGKETESQPDSTTQAWSAWFLTLYTTAEFRYLSDI